MVGNFGFFEHDLMPFGLCNALATFQWLMQNCLGDLNLIYCLNYLDISHILTECSFLKKEINYLAHQVSRECVQPSQLNLKAVAECAPPQTYTEMCAFLGLVGHYW